MNIVVTRSEFTEKSTISDVTVDGTFECFFLEDKDRGLSDTMTLEEIKSKKVHAQTCIPYGKYKVIVTKSERFSRIAGHDIYLPLICNIKGFNGVRIHSGNKPEDTEGCPLTGTQKGKDVVLNSRTAFIKLNDKINKALQTEKVTIEFKKVGL